MDPRLQEMLDHYEIRKTLAEYCHGCDRCDEPRMASVYAADSWDDHGHRRAPGPEYSRLMAAEVLATTDSMYHLLGQSLVRVSGDEAGAETYFLAVSRTTGEDGREMCNQLGGRFVDQLVREDGRWRIKHRTVMRDWGISLPVEQDWTADAGLRPGERSDADPALGALGLAHGGVRPAEGLSWR
jgi:hypothetical protein